MSQHDVASWDHSPALQALHDYLTRQHSLDILDAVPGHTEIEWADQLGQKETGWYLNKLIPLIPQDIAPNIIVIGKTSDKRGVVLACLHSSPNVAREIRFFTYAISTIIPTLVPIRADNVGKLGLFPPFCYFKGESKTNQRQLKLLLKYYYLSAGVVSDGIGGNFKEFGKRLLRIFKHIQAQSLPKEGEKEEEEEEEEEDEEGRTLDTLDTPDPRDQRHLRLSSHVELDEYLRKENAHYLLSHIPTHSTMRFEWQRSMPDAEPVRLQIGWLAVLDENAEQPIWAYLRPGNGKIIYESGSDDATSSFDPDALPVQKLLCPFNYAFVSKRSLDSSERRRITALIRFYYLWSGHTKVGVSASEMERALRYIHSRIEVVDAGLATESPATESTNTPEASASSHLPRATRDASNNFPTLEDSPDHGEYSFTSTDSVMGLDEGTHHATGTPYATPGPSTRKRSASRQITREHSARSNASDISLKRLALDQAFEDFHRQREKEGLLSTDIDNAKAKLEELEVQYQTALETQQQHRRLIAERTASMGNSSTKLLEWRGWLDSDKTLMQEVGSIEEKMRETEQLVEQLELRHRSLMATVRTKSQRLLASL